MLQIWGRLSSINVQKVMWLIGELDVPYEHIPAGGKFGGLDSQEFLNMNPHGRIPVINDHGVIIWESHSILRYLAARYGKEYFWSNDPIFRAKVDSWMDWAQTTLQPDFLTGVFWNFYRTPENQRDWKAIQISLERCHKHFKLLDRILAQQTYLSGHAFSLGDIPVGALLYRYYELEIERPKTPNVENWYKKLQDRPAYQKYVMVPFEELKGRLEY